MADRPLASSMIWVLFLSLLNVFYSLFNHCMWQTGHWLAVWYGFWFFVENFSLLDEGGSTL